MSLTRLSVRAVKALPLAALLAVAACSNNIYADVTRFHSNAPISRGTLAIVPTDPALANNLEFRTHAETVAVQMRRLGYTTGLPANQVDYVAAVEITQIGPSPAQGNGTRRNPTMRSSTLSVTIQRRADGAQIWQGRATKQVPAADDLAAATNAVPALADALFREFPGTPGQTVRVRL